VGGYSPVYSFTTEPRICAGSSLPVPDGLADGVKSQIVFEETAIIQDVNVWIDMSHTWVGDLKFVLEHLDSGTQITLIDRPGVPVSTFGCGYDDIAVVLDDEGDTLVEDVCNASGPALADTLRPMEALVAFNGQIGTGVWQLSVMDTTDSDFGVLNDWCLLPTYDLLDKKVFLPAVTR
jgi:subtilisin-like proprotein convertase family protein